MGRLFLSGGGNDEKSLIINRIFVREIDKQKPILYLPIAGDSNFRPYASSHQYMKKVFSPLGIDEVTMWTDVVNKTFEDLQDFSAVYISGGDPFRLLSKFRKTGFDKVLTRYLENGGTLFGQSAGAMVFGKNLKMLPDTGTFGLINNDAMNLVNGYSIEPHFKEDDFGMNEYAGKYSCPVIALPEGTALLVKNAKMKVIGIQPAYEFNRDGKTEIQPEN